MAAPAVLDIVCPRCQAPAAVRFYGPCDTCRDELRGTLGGTPSEVAAPVKFEPKMHVVANHVAASRNDT